MARMITFYAPSGKLMSIKHVRVCSVTVSGNVLTIHKHRSSESYTYETAEAATTEASYIMRQM